MQMHMMMSIFIKLPEERVIDPSQFILSTKLVYLAIYKASWFLINIRTHTNFIPGFGLTNALKKNRNLSQITTEPQLAVNEEKNLMLSPNGQSHDDMSSNKVR